MKNLITGAALLLCILQAKAQAPAPATTPPAKAEFKLIFEKVYLHTDRDVYAQGDTLWFKAYLINGQTNQPATSSGNLYVELIAPGSAKIINREIIRLDNGLGHGDMDIIDILPAGKYTLRAYTNWMRNFGDNFIFKKEITVLDENISNPAAPPNKIIPAKNKNSAVATTPVSTASPAPVIRFYPEGGSMVDGLSSIVAIKAEDGYGKGIAVTGSILSAGGDTVARFNCDTLGMGLFAMLPVGGQTYHAVANLASIPQQGKSDLIFNLPAALSKGPTLQIRQTDSVIHAIVSTNDTLTGKPVYTIAIKHGGITQLHQQLQMNGPQISARIATSTLPEGIAAITLYDAKGKPECERLVYIHHPGSAPKTIVTTNKKTYQPKEQVTVNINTQPNANLSMAVVDAGIAPQQADDIASYLLLKSEIKGVVENARRYFDTTNVNRFKQLDLLLMTQGWRDFVWRRLADTAIRISYAAEDGINVSGKVRDEVLNKMMPGLNISLFANGAKGNKIFSAVTDSVGRFNISGLMLYGQQRVKLGSVNAKGQEKGSFMLDTILPMPISPVVKPMLNQQRDSVATIAVEKRAETIKNARIGNVTKLKEVNIKAKQTAMLNNGSVLTTWGTDQIFTIKPEDEKYKTLEWYLLQNAKGAYQGMGHEYTGVVFMGIDTIKHIVPSPSGGLVTYIGRSTYIPPQIFINGRELYMDERTQAEDYRNIYFNMSITKFKKIVLKHMTGTIHGRSAAGTLLNPAAEMVNVDRYLLYLTLDESAMFDNPGSLNPDITGYYEARNFYKPLPNARPSINDYRTTINWEPDIKTDATGKASVSFYNALPQTDVRIVVQGITSSGAPVASTTDYAVK
jgi:hypothetical protein